ncbi:MULTISPECIES: hypothetical protein [unclassified Nocardia]|uniref:LppU/SCO3897 family protein n=1 Tax=unclassified Nocardia TaxID=2637762 RepID=UPI00278C5154|nr:MULTISPECIES: hypothetical protein [unclassified Nocardia]
MNSDRPSGSGIPPAVSPFDENPTEVQNVWPRPDAVPGAPSPNIPQPPPTPHRVAPPPAPHPAVPAPASHSVAPPPAGPVGHPPQGAHAPLPPPAGQYGHQPQDASSAFPQSHDPWGAATEPAGSGLPHYPPTTNGTPPPRSRRWLWVALAATVVLVAAAISTTYVLTRPEPIALAVDDCVSILDQDDPVEYTCGQINAAYRIVARESVVYPVESACMKYDDATRAVLDDADEGSDPDTVLCLAPTRVNTADPGAIETGDCVKVTDGGATVTRVACTPESGVAEVLAIRLHTRVPVTDRACHDVPSVRKAFAYSSLGGRALVLCVRAADPSSTGNAETGDCVNENMTSIVACTLPEAAERVLTVRVQHTEPAAPECLGVIGATGFTMNTHDTTDLVVALCVGPVDDADVGYAMAGDCVIPPDEGNDFRPTKADCSDPAASVRVTSRHDTDTAECPGDYVARMTRKPGVTNGMTLCFTSN